MKVYAVLGIDLEHPDDHIVRVFKYERDAVAASMQLTLDRLESDTYYVACTPVTDKENLIPTEIEENNSLADEMSGKQQ